MFKFRSQFKAKLPHSGKEAAARIRNFYQAGVENLSFFSETKGLIRVFGLMTQNNGGNRGHFNSL